MARTRRGQPGSSSRGQAQAALIAAKKETFQREHAGWKKRMGTGCVWAYGEEAVDEVDVVDVAIPADSQTSRHTQTLSASFFRPQPARRQSVPPASIRAQVDSRSDLDALEELVNLVVRELLAERGEDVLELALADVAVVVLVKHLKSADELVCSVAWGCNQHETLGMPSTARECRGRGRSLPAVPAGSNPPSRWRIDKNWSYVTAQHQQQWSAEAPEVAMGCMLTLSSCCCCQLSHLLLSRILAQSAEDVAERLLRDRLRTALVEQGERLLGLWKHNTWVGGSAGCCGVELVWGGGWVLTDQLG